MANISVVTILLVTSLIIFCQFNAADATIGYHLWFDDDAANSAVEKISLAAKPNDKFIKIMDLAAKQNPTYKYEFKQYSFGKYITAINGVKEDPDKKVYWMIYNMTAAPDPNSTPDDEYLSPVGVDLLDVEDKKYYLFWRKVVNY